MVANDDVCFMKLLLTKSSRQIARHISFLVPQSLTVNYAWCRAEPAPQQPAPGRKGKRKSEPRIVREAKEELARERSAQGMSPHPVVTQVATPAAKGQATRGQAAQGAGAQGGSVANGAAGGRARRPKAAPGAVQAAQPAKRKKSMQATAS